MTPILLLFAVWPFHGPAADVTTERHHVDAWNITIRRSRFTGAKDCSLVAPAMAVEHDALVLNLGRRTNTVEAKYKVDDGPLLTSASDISELADQGFQLYTDDLTNPSGGVVRIPLHRLKDA